MPSVQTVAELMQQMQDNYRPEKAAGLTATFNFKITGTDGGEWNARIVDGEGEMFDGLSPDADVTINAESDDWAQIVTGMLNPQMAFMTGKLTVDGDLGLATKLQTLFL